MHYLASGKANLVWHLTHAHRTQLLHTAKELRRWSAEELANVHRDLHDDGLGLTGMELPARPSSGGSGALRAFQASAKEPQSVGAR